MEMKWHPINDGDLSGIPRDEELLFTVFDEEDGETYATSCWIEEEYTGNLGVTPNGMRYYPVQDVKAWMDLPLPYKPKNKCLSCKHLEEWCDEFGESWSECDLRKNVPVKPGDCPLDR